MGAAVDLEGAQAVGERAQGQVSELQDGFLGGENTVVDRQGLAEGAGPPRGAQAGWGQGTGSSGCWTAQELGPWGLPRAMGQGGSEGTGDCPLGLVQASRWIKNS